MPVVESGDGSQPKTLGHGNQAGVESAKWVVAVLRGQLGDARPISRGQLFDRDLARSDCPIERRFFVWAQELIQVPAGFANDRSGSNQQTSLAA